VAGWQRDPARFGEQNFGPQQLLAGEGQAQQADIDVAAGQPGWRLTRRPAEG
jgi:hypothetical protein